MSEAPPLVTSLSYFSDLSECSMLIEPPIPGSHILLVHLNVPGNFAVTSPGSRIFEPTLKLSDDQYAVVAQNRIKALEEIVFQDQQADPRQRIDCVHVEGTDWGSPDEVMWEILGGLNPKHLILVGGRSEDCNLSGISAVQGLWTNLRTLNLGGMATNSEPYELPELATQITSLTLDLCCHTTFRSPEGFSLPLQHLEIQGNDAGEMFIDLFKNFPSIAGTLQSLIITNIASYGDFRQFHPNHLRSALVKCKKLHDLRLALRPKDALDTNIASFFPDSIQTLSFKGVRSMPFLRDLDDWVQHARDAAWLPELKSFQLSVDTTQKVSPKKGFTVVDDVNPLNDDRPKFQREDEHPYLSLGDFDDEDSYNGPQYYRVQIRAVEEPSCEAFDAAFAAKRKELYDALKLSRPDIELIF